MMAKKLLTDTGLLAHSSVRVLVLLCCVWVEGRGPAILTRKVHLCCAFMWNAHSGSLIRNRSCQRFGRSLPCAASMGTEAPARHPPFCVVGSAFALVVPPVQVSALGKNEASYAKQRWPQGSPGSVSGTSGRGL